MSTYNGRRAPNVSQYLTNLNHIPSAHDIPNALHIGEADLDFLTNAEFFDFDSFHPNNVDFHTRSPDHGEKGHRAPAALGGPQYQFGEFQTYPATVGSSPLAANLHGQYPSQPNHQLPYTGPNAGDKRKASVATNIASPVDLEEESRMAAEEDKRRRNTAASARFRVKKKQREQALEKQSKEMSEKVSQLEGKVQQLEMENKWLKGLLTDKNDGKNFETLQKEKDAADRKTDDNTDGVGTVDEEEEEEEEEHDADAEAEAEA